MAAAMLRGRWFRFAAVLLVLGAAAVAFYVGSAGNLTTALTIGAAATAAALLLLHLAGAPGAFLLLVAAAGIANSAGYAFGLWKQIYLFDELVHFFTSFVVSALVGWTIAEARDWRLRDGRLVACVAAAGFGLGLLWEGFEWAIGLIGGPADTAIDVAMDTAGAVAAGLFCARAVADREKERA